MEVLGSFEVFPFIAGDFLCVVPLNLTPRKITCPLKINGWKMHFLFKWSLFRGHAEFFGGIKNAFSQTFLSWKATIQQLSQRPPFRGGLTADKEFLQKAVRSVVFG